MINSNWHPISYRFGVIATYCSNFGHFAFFIRLWGSGSTYDVHRGLIGKLVCDRMDHMNVAVPFQVEGDVHGPPPIIRSNWPRWSEIADFRSIFARSASAVSSSEKSSIITNRKSTRRFTMSPRWTSYVVSSPQRVAQKRKVSKIWTISCDNSATVRERLSVTINH